MNYSELIARLDCFDHAALQEALDLRQTLLDEHSAAIRQIEKLEQALKEYAKGVASDGSQSLGFGNSMKITLVNTRVVNDNSAALSWMAEQQINPSEYVTISAEKTAKFLPANLISTKPSVRVTFK